MEPRSAPADALPTNAIRKATAALLAMALIWALNFSIAKEALDSVAPLVFNTLRFPMAAAVVTIVFLRRSGFHLPEPGDRLRIVGLALLGNVIYQFLFIFGLANTRAGTASVLLAGTPIVTGIFSAAIGHEHVTRRVWTGAAATVVGISLVVFSSAAVPAPGENRLIGSLLMVGATIAWAAYSVGSRTVIQRYGALPVTTWTLWAGTLGIVAVGLPATVATDLGALGAAEWSAIVYAGAFSIGLAYVLWSYGVRHLGATKTATFSNIVPVIALAAAWLMLDERPTPGQIAGAAVIIGGVTFAQVRGRRVPVSTPRSPIP